MIFMIFIICMNGACADAERAAATVGGDHGDDPRRVALPRRCHRRSGHKERGAIGQ